MGAEQSTARGHAAAQRHARTEQLPLTRPSKENHIDTSIQYTNEKLSSLNLQDEGTALSSRDASRVSASSTQHLVEHILADPKNRLALSALSTADPAQVLQSRKAVLADTHTFNVAIPHEGSPVTNQRASGRCWLFASTNVFRIAIAKRYNLGSFELSQSYLFFWDKVEKANLFLENVIDIAKDESTDGRLAKALFASPIGDGGQWDMVANLVHKYGICPQVLYPDSWNAMNSARMDSLITTKLREEALKLHTLVHNGSGRDDEKVRRIKEAAMRDVVRIVTLALGPPPPADKPFHWEYHDKAGKFHSLDMSPLDFAASLSDKTALRVCGGVDVASGLFSLVNDPRNKYSSLLTIDKLGNVLGGRPVTYVNEDMSVLKDAAIAMLKKGLPVFFGCDSGKYTDGQKGLFDLDLIDYELGFGVKLAMSKAQRLMTGESAMTHAMVLTAVNLSPEGEPIRWRIENSWSAERGDHGYFIASDKWMDEFCYQVVIDPSVVGDEVLEVLEQKPKILPLWDPMGALA